MRIIRFAGALLLVVGYPMQTASQQNNTKHSADLGSEVTNTN